MSTPSSIKPKRFPTIPILERFPPCLFFAKENGRWFPCRFGEMPTIETRKEWNDLKKEIDDFYLNISDEKIELLNDEIEAPYTRML